MALGALNPCEKTQLLKITDLSAVASPALFTHAAIFAKSLRKIRMGRREGTKFPLMNYTNRHGGLAGDCEARGSAEQRGSQTAEKARETSARE